MTKRILIGNDGSGNFRIRASAAGHNVETAPLDQILFDADAVPGRIIAQGAQWCDYNFFQPSHPQVPQVTAIPHGVPAGMHFMVVAIARAQRDDGVVYSDWGYYRYELFTPTSEQRVVVARPLENPAMAGQYCTPHRFAGDDGNGFPYWGGWWVHWDNSNIYITNNTPHGIWVRWQALEV